jgi:hypothetical protein
MKKIGSRLARAVNALDHGQIVALIALTVVALTAFCTPVGNNTHTIIEQPKSVPR